MKIAVVQQNREVLHGLAVLDSFMILNGNSGLLQSLNMYLLLVTLAL